MGTKIGRKVFTLVRERERGKKTVLLKGKMTALTDQKRSKWCWEGGGFINPGVYI